MRITNQMLNESARKSGLPINRSSLLDYINKDGSSNPLLEALNKNKEIAANSAKKDSYEKLDKEADLLTQATEGLLQDGENNLFEQAKATGDKQKVYDSIENLLESYNSTLKALRSTSNTMNDFYRQMLIEAPEDAKEELAKVGVSFAKDGTASVDMDKLKSADIESLENLFGSKSEVVSKVKFIATRISNNAEASVKSYSSGYSSKGNLYNGSVNSRFDFRG